jgi:IS5 family transposase
MQPSLWESVSPEVCLRLPAELVRRMSGWTTNDSSPPSYRTSTRRIGQPSVPIQTYLRLTFLKHRYQLRLRELCAEAADSISWRWFCRIDIESVTPDHP